MDATNTHSTESLGREEGGREIERERDSERERLRKKKEKDDR